MNQLAHKCQMPWWLTVIIVIETLPMFLGPIFALNNPAFLGGPEATEVGFATWLYTARNFAVGIAFVVAYLLRSAPMLFILILIRLLTDLVDGPAVLLLGMASNEIRLIAIFVIGYYIPALIALRFFWKQMTSSTAAE
ncbi:MAG: hypothetical protein VX388_07415 [Pseudomonadota bacterium]|nr:hypothetical protein [Pseudomonadota bacterium]MEC7518133.1 hypothetical protein [Pseudomonadota bacterium]MEC8007450.1 hypothetical protein [Pseudomonadota bacterium]MEC8267263.1 hypothetical protein [Pseudomonadota bacterium]MED5356571.1 hypothetical protein [Pseudomonadota bacterium]